MERVKHRVRGLEQGWRWESGGELIFLPSGEVLRLIGEDLEGDGSVVEAVAREDVYCLDDSVAGRLVVVEEVPAKKDKVGVLLGGDLEYLLERPEGVVAAHFIVLPDALGGERGGSLSGGREWRHFGGRWGQSEVLEPTRWLSVAMMMRRTSCSCV